MKTIKYNNKEYKLPFDVALPEDAKAEDTVRNRFGVSHAHCQRLLLLCMM